MDGFGSHTFSMVNGKNERFFVKYHVKTKQGIKNLPPAQALALAGSDPDHAQRDLFEAIERGDHPKWTMMIQVMPEAEAAKYEINPFDVTKVWSHQDYPRIEVGEVVLNKNIFVRRCATLSTGRQLSPDPSEQAGERSEALSP